MKPAKPRVPVDALTRRAIAARLQQPPEADEQRWVDALCASYLEHFGEEPDREEVRRLFWEVKLGLDGDWPTPRVEDEPEHPGWLALCAATAVAME